VKAAAPHFRVGFLKGRMWQWIIFLRVKRGVTRSHDHYEKKGIWRIEKGRVK
jgi:hypothetical protein